MTYRCRECRQSYHNCKCEVYMSESYTGTLADHKAFLNSQRSAVTGPVARSVQRSATMRRKVNKNAIAALLGAFAGLFLSACASTKPAPVTFVAPSVAPVKQAVTRVEQHVKGATDAAKKLEAECATKSAGWASAYETLNTELANAYAGLASAQDMADTLQRQANDFAQQANQVAAQRDAYYAKLDSLEASRHGWVKRFWLASGIAAALGLWTFRKPLMLLVGL